MIYLASHSPRRKALLEQINVPFEVIPQFSDESHYADESAQDYVIRLALAKAQDGMSRQKNKNIPVLGSDTSVILNDTILGKPKNKNHAIDMLLSLSGQTHQVMTAVALVNEHQIEHILSITQVSFTSLTESMCEHYWLSGEASDKAGSYAIQGLGALFITNINGSYSGVMGLPIYETSQLLNKFLLNA